MRVGVIRGDLPGPIMVTDLEPVSRYNATTEPRGQERYLGRPTIEELEAVLANATSGAGAVIEGADIAANFPITINAMNDDLKVRTSATAAFTTVLIAQAAYANLTDLLAAVNNALEGTGITARQGTGAGSRVALEGAHGVSSYVETDSVANGSVANTPLGLANGGSIRTMPTAADFITACLPVGGPLDVSTATINGVGAGTDANAMSLIPTARGTHTEIAEAIAPQFYETPVAIDSVLVGQLSGLLNASFNPDPRRVPALASGPAIEVVQNDGVTPYAPSLPVIAAASINAPGAGDVTITGTGLGDSERNETRVKFTGVVNKLFEQAYLEANGGSVTDTAIVIPAALIPGAAAGTSSVIVQVRQRVSATEDLA